MNSCYFQLISPNPVVLLTICFFLVTEVIAQKEIKIITYNVLEGLGNNSSYGVDRHENFVSWIQAQKPDIVALQEMYGSEEQLAKDARTWGHSYYAILNDKGAPIALTSNQPIVVKRKYREEFWHGMLHCETYGIDFLVVHLSPADWKYRLSEARLIAGIVDSIKQDTERYVLLGDFNSHSPFDDELYLQNPGLKEKYQRGDLTNKEKENPHRSLAEGHIDYSVMSKFLSFPLVDVTQRFIPFYQRHTFPSPILIGVWRTAGNIGRTPERIDYILTSITFAQYCRSVRVHNGEENDYLSDHYPVEAVFEIGK